MSQLVGNPEDRFSYDAAHLCLQMAEGGFSLQNQLKFNLDVPLSAANIALR